MAYQKLTTMKYWRASATSEIAQAKKAQNGRSVRSFNMFLVAYLVIMGFTYLVNQNPDWVPSALTYIEQTGIFQQLR